MLKVEIVKSQVKNLEKGDVINVRVYHDNTGMEWVKVIAVHTNSSQLRKLADANRRAYSNGNCASIGAALKIESEIDSPRWDNATSAIIEVKGTSRDCDRENFISTRQLNLVDVQL